uniref:Peptidase M13 C-terminal domain-containing protein n=2 Tax=Tetranychus urticae TaxID=32264 RepID=T1KPP5_TETUR
MWTTSLAQVKINNRLKVLLESINTTQNDNYLTKMKNLYDLCMDKDNLENLGSSLLLGVLDQLGGWPVVSGTKWKQDEFDVVDTLVNMRKYGYPHDIFASITISPHIFYQKFNVIYIGEANLALEERSYYEEDLDDPVLQEYLRFMVKSSVYLGADQALAEAEMAKVLQFAIQLALLTISRNTPHNYYNPMKIDQLQALSQEAYNWTQYFNGIFDPFSIVNNDSYIIVYVPNYIKAVSELIESTDKRVLANYLLWRVVLSSTVLLDERWALLGREFYQHIDGRKSLKPRHSFCMETVKKYFNIGSSGLYINATEDKSNLNLMSKMTEYIKESFVGMIKSSDWMDAQSMEAALNKTSLMTLHVGYPQELTDFDIINDYYQEVPTGRNTTWFEMILFLRHWKKDKDYLKITTGNEKGFWVDYSNVIDINAYYRHQENSIQFPLSIIESTGINADYPMYLNFGAVGWIIGHEISHGFDTVGRKFDEHGNYENWWSDSTTEKFEAKTRCYAEQYSQFELKKTGEKVNGNRTLAENIADNGGMKQAIVAYKKYVKDHGEEPLLPGLKYNPYQLFFIRSAHFYCGKWRTPALSHMIRTDVHSPGIFRIIGTLSNMVEFSEAFNCPSKAKMNPEKKCTLW